MEETTTIEYIIGGLGLLFLIGIGVLLGYLWSELKWKARETKRMMIDQIDGHQIADRTFLHKDSDNRAEGKKHHTTFKSRSQTTFRSKV